jgi:hypothetical protein
MFPVFDVSDWERLNAEQMGTKPKFWCLDEAGAEFLFKESRPHSGEHWSEKIAEQIAAALRLPHAEIELAICGGRQGTISRKFLPETKNTILAHGNELLFEHDPMYPKNAPNFRLAQHTLNRIFDALQKEKVNCLPTSGDRRQSKAQAMCLSATFCWTRSSATLIGIMRTGVLLFARRKMAPESWNWLPPSIMRPVLGGN